MRCPRVYTVRADVRTNFTLAAADQTTAAPAITVTNGHDFGVGAPATRQVGPVWRNTTNGDVGIWYMNGSALWQCGCDFSGCGLELGDDRYGRFQQ